MLPKNLCLWSSFVQFHLHSVMLNYKNQKSHICEEGGAHLKISVWHLLMNLKSNYLLKKLLKWDNKKCKNFNIYNVD